MGAAYTANMANFLVSPRVSVYKFNTIQDVLRSDASLCVQSGGTVQAILQNKFPALRFVPKTSEQEIYESLRIPPDQGGCDAAAHQFNSFTVYRQNKDVNNDCSLASQEKPVVILSAGMATAVDTAKYCTSLVSHVLDYHLALMQADGFIERAWKNHVDRLSTVECIKEKVATANTDASTFRLGLQDVGGIFILHGILSMAALSLSIFQFYSHRNLGQ
jgi:hypothetical protein